MLIESAASDEELSIESEFATTIKYIDLYLRQKTDLFLQNYVFEPFEFLAKNFMCLSVIVPLLAAGKELAQMVEQNLIRTEGKGRATRYVMA